MESATPMTASPPEERVLLHNISWETYERLLAENPDACGTRFFYNDGELEIMVVYIGHEQPNRALAALAENTAFITGRDFCRTGSSTYQREDLAKGFEPDSSFYFRNAKSVRGKKEIDLANDPPPELVIEVDISRSSLNRFPIFAAIGVAEIWRYDGNRVRFYRLEGREYSEIEDSRVLPPMTAKQATLFVERDSTDDAVVWLRAVHEWVRARLNQ
jgi:Uma2 family endonuclease